MASDSAEAPIARAVLITLAVLALYVLSIGPAWRYFVRHGHDAPRWFRTVYYPIGWIGARYRPVGEAFNWYADHWEK